MGFCFGFMTNDTSMTACALSPFHEALRLDQGAPQGWGMGYYQAGQPLLRKQPKPPDGPLDFVQAAGHLKTNLIMGHVREATIGSCRTENTHPFRYRNWIFCHTGTMDRFDRIREEMLKAVPEFIRRNIRGKTDSEHLFHLFLSFLNDTGKLDDPRLAPEIPARALASTIAYVDRLVQDQGGTLASSASIISNGELLIATSRQANMKVLRSTSFTPLDPDGRPSQVAHLRAVMITAGNSPSLPGWERVADRATVTVDSRLNIEHTAPI